MTHEIDNVKIENLLNLAKKISLHQQFDHEVNIVGNGVNSHTALTCMHGVLQILNLKYPHPTRQEILLYAEENGINMEL